MAVLKNYFLKTICIILLTLFATPAGAVDQLPEVMVGQSRIEESSNTTYGGFTGNEVNFQRQGVENQSG